MGVREADRRAAEVGATMLARDRTSRHFGMALLECRVGYARLEMEVVDTMVNGHDLCHGGVLFTLADSAFAFACNSHGEVAVAQRCDITFLRPARRGDVLVAEAREVDVKGRSGVTDVVVRERDSGGVVALFRGLSRTVGGAVAGGRG